MVESSTAAVQPVKRVELTRIGNRAVSLHGWRSELVEDHLKEHLGKPMSKRWCPVGCMARTMFGRDTMTNRDGVRRRVAPTFKSLLDHGLFLVIEYMTGKDHGKIQAVKLFEKGEGLEQQHAAVQINRMRHRRQVSDEVWMKAMQTLGLSVTTPGDGGEVGG